MTNEIEPADIIMIAVDVLLITGLQVMYRELSVNTPYKCLKKALMQYE